MPRLLNDNEIADVLMDKQARMDQLWTVVDESGQKVQYCRRDVQRDFAENRHGLDVVLKSRQHGISTETDLDILDDAVNIPNLQCGIIAHTKIDAQELFETKVKLPYYELHEQLRRYCPATKCDAGTLRLANGSEIRVAVSFRSATTHRLHISEYGEICSKYPLRADEIKTGTLPSLHPQLGGRAVIEGTAHGAGGHFYELCMQAQADTVQAEAEGRPLNVLQYKFHFYPWWKDPKNAITPVGIRVSDELKRYFTQLADNGIVTTIEQQAWYAVKRDGAGGLGQDMKREHPSTVEEAFETSVEGAVYAQEMEKARSDGRIGFFPHVQNQPVYTAWDLGYGDATAVAFVQFIGQEIRFIDFHEQAGRGASYHVAQLRNRENYIYREHYMPHDVMNHEKGTGIVLADTYQALFGLNEQLVVVGRPALKADAHSIVRDAFPQFHFNVKTCKRLIQGLSYYRYEWLEDMAKFSKDPIHDWASHIADAVQTLACQYRSGPIAGRYLGSVTPKIMGPEGQSQNKGTVLDFGVERDPVWT